MGRARGENNSQATTRCNSDRASDDVRASEHVSDRFAAVLGTTRGSNRVEMTDEQEAAEARDALLERVVEDDGEVRYYDDEGELHREDGPAVVWPSGAWEWRQHGERHREDGPSIERPDGSREWHQHGELHRIGGPALERANGQRGWYQHDLLHRENGPAVEQADGTCLWYLHGKRQPDQS